MLSYILLGIYSLLRAYYFIIFAGIILSWIPGARRNGFFKFVYKLGDLYMGCFRGRFIVGFLDLSSLFGLLIYEGIMDLFFVAFF